MAKPQKYKILLDKALAAAISAIEVYNKPDFKYREETFSILMVNAWEILLKAKILKDNKSNLKSIYVPERTRTKDNRKIRRFYPKKNRAGNSMTVDIFSALEGLSLDKVLKENIQLLLEIRDNAIHFTNKEKLFEKKVLEIGTANLKSFVTVFNDWFKYDLSQYNFYLMPISFFHPLEFESFSINKFEKQMKNVLNYIKKKERKYPSDENKPHNISLILETKFVKSTEKNAFLVRYSEDADALKIKIEEEQLLKTKYPLSYYKLCDQCEERYSDFKTNKKFFDLKKQLEEVANFKYARPRYLDPENLAGVKKIFYGTEILKEFDKHYTKKI